MKNSALRLVTTPPHHGGANGAPRASCLILMVSVDDGSYVNFAAQAVLDGSIPPSTKSRAVNRNAPSLNDRRASVKLKHALEACLFGSGLLAGRGITGITSITGIGFGLPDATAANVSGRTFSVASYGSKAASAARTAGASSPRSVPPSASASASEVRQACALMQGLVEDGARIRDLLLVLLAMLEERERERRRPPSRLPSSASTEPGSSSPRWQSAADVVASLLPEAETEFCGGTLARVVRAFVGWLADTPWVGGVTEGAEGEDWEGDFAAAALAISAVFPTPFSAAVAAGRDIYAAPTGVGGGGGRIQAGGASWGSSSGSVDAADVLDRLVAGVAAAMGHATGNAVEWTVVLRRMAAAATATDSLVAYAVACVEKSTALGGQAPFRMPGRGKRRFAQVGGKELWGLLDGVRVLNEGLLTGEQAPTSVLVRAAAGAVAASRRTRCGPCLLWYRGRELRWVGVLADSSLLPIIDAKQNNSSVNFHVCDTAALLFANVTHQNPIGSTVY